MRKFVMLFLLAVTALALGACAHKPAQDAAEEIRIELSASDFTEGSHKRSAEYMAAFKTRCVELEGLGIRFASDVFDETLSPSAAEEIAEAYYSLRSHNGEKAAALEIYIVSITPTGGPVKLGGKLYITSEYVDKGSYRPYMASLMYGLDDWWKCVGLTALAGGGDDTELAADLAEYLDANETSRILSLHPCFFIEEFVDDDTRDLAERCAMSLSQFIIERDGFEAFAADSGASSRELWSAEMGLDCNLSWLNSAAAARLEKMEFSEADKIPLILSSADFRLNIEKVDWLPDAESVFCFLLDLARQIDTLYSRFESEAPVFYAKLQEDEGITDVNFRGSDYPLSSRASMLKQEALVTDDADVLHELVHTLMPRAEIEECWWLCEGLVTYLTAPLVPYFADSIVVDSVMAEHEDDTEEDRELRAETVRCFEKLNGFPVSPEMDEPIYRIYEASAYAAFLNPDNNSMPAATQSIRDQYAAILGNSAKWNYPGNKLSYCQSMVFTAWLVEKYGLEMLIAAETEKESYFELFPDDAAFEAEFAEFWMEKVEAMKE